MVLLWPERLPLLVPVSKRKTWPNLKISLNVLLPTALPFPALADHRHPFAVLGPSDVPDWTVDYAVLRLQNVRLINEINKILRTSFYRLGGVPNAHFAGLVAACNVEAGWGVSCNLGEHRMFRVNVTVGNVLENPLKP